MIIMFSMKGRHSERSGISESRVIEGVNCHRVRIQARTSEVFVSIAERLYSASTFQIGRSVYLGLGLDTQAQGEDYGEARIEDVDVVSKAKEGGSLIEDGLVGLWGIWEGECTVGTKEEEEKKKREEEKEDGLGGDEWRSVGGPGEQRIESIGGWRSNAPTIG